MFTNVVWKLKVNHLVELEGFTQPIGLVKVSPAVIVDGLRGVLLVMVGIAFVVGGEVILVLVAAGHARNHGEVVGGGVAAVEFWIRPAEK